MKQLLFISFFFALISCKGQKESPGKTSVADKLVGYYNRAHYDSIFHLFDPEMKKALPLKKTNEFFSEMQKASGEIMKYEFKEKVQTASRYKTVFSNDIYWMSISENTKGEIDGLYFTVYDGTDAASSTARNTTKMILPFEGEWFVFWGGDTKEQNYHVVNKAQKNAFDIVIMDEKGRSFKTNGKTNEDYYAFGQPLIASCDAEVVTVIEGVKDNNPGEMNPAQVTGNSVVLKTAANEYILYAHFKMNTIKVKVGDKVKQGELLGLCGNSGNSSEPHLHFHIQDKENMMSSTGIKCYFEKILVNAVVKTDYSPVKNDRIKNAD
ncbi:MAG: peptidoglycan DD-metalloendopeptidase family protein [Chitinophagaceae bacterium]|nr:peptidoglycan DD-metalloendopeptidase family protein [Chitinophagaceae bacterium]